MLEEKARNYIGLVEEPRLTAGATGQAISYLHGYRDNLRCGYRDGAKASVIVT